MVTVHILFRQTSGVQRLLGSVRLWCTWRLLWYLYTFGSDKPQVFREAGRLSKIVVYLEITIVPVHVLFRYTSGVQRG